VSKFMVGSVVGAFTLIVLGMGGLIAIDNENAQLYLGAIILVAVLGTVLTFGVLLHNATPGPEDRDRRETYARVMIALVTATAGTAGGVGGGAVASNGQADAAKAQAAAAERTADTAEKKVDQVEALVEPQPKRPRQP